MITTVRLVNIHHLIQVQFFSLTMRTFTFYSLSNFQYIQCSTVGIVSYITSQELISLTRGSSYHRSHSPNSPIPDNHKSGLLFQDGCFFFLNSKHM